MSNEIIIINDDSRYVIISKPVFVYYNKNEINNLIQSIIPFLVNGYKCFYCENGEPITNNYVDNLKIVSDIIKSNNIDKKLFTIIYENNSESFLKYLDGFGFDYIFVIKWLLWATPKEFINTNYLAENLNKKFLFLNRIQKSHRIELLDFFEKEGILDNSHYSARWKNLSNLDEDYNSDSVKLRVDIHTHLLNIYQQSYVHIVTETNWSDKSYEIDKMFFSEKTFRHLAFNRPFILVGQRNSLNKLKEYGFKTFSPFIDESYDSLNEEDRMEYIKQIIIDLNNKSNYELYELCKNCEEIFTHNRKRLFELANEIKKNVNEKYPLAYKKLEQLFLNYQPI